MLQRKIDSEEVMEITGLKENEIIYYPKQKDSK